MQILTNISYNHFKYNNKEISIPCITEEPLDIETLEFLQEQFYILGTQTLNTYHPISYQLMIDPEKATHIITFRRYPDIPPISYDSLEYIKEDIQITFCDFDHQVNLVSDNLTIILVLTAPI